MYVPVCVFVFVCVRACVVYMHVSVSFAVKFAFDSGVLTAHTRELTAEDGTHEKISSQILCVFRKDRMERNLNSPRVFILAF